MRNMTHLQVFSGFTLGEGFNFLFLVMLLFREGLLERSPTPNFLVIEVK